MSMETKKTISLVLLAISVLSWILRRAGLLYIPGLTAFALAVAMLLLGTATLRANKQRKAFSIAVVAFGLLNVVVGALELYSYFRK